ncbi:hypothetical protein D9M71_256000 [compost metagenome]
MATPGRHGRGLHAGRATAHHHHALAHGRRVGLRIDQLAAGFRVLDAGNGVAAMEVADARLVAGDAGAHVVAAAGGGLVGHLRVADQGAGHAADVGLAAGEDGFGFLGLVDPPGDEKRDVQPRLEAPGGGCQVGGFDGHGRDDMDGAAERGRGAGHQVHVVELPLQGERGCQGFVLGQAFRVTLVGGDAHPDDEVVGAVGAHGQDHFADEAQAGVEVAVVAVFAAVHPRVEELRGQVAVAGDDLHAVQSGRAQAPGGGTVAGDDLVDHPLVQSARHHAEALVGRGRGGPGHRQQSIAGFHDFPARMEHLGKHHRAFGVAGLGQAPVTLDAGVVGGHQYVGGVAGAVVYPGHLQHDQADAAPGAGAVIGDELLVDQVVGGHRGVVAAGHDPVLQAFATDFQGFEEVREAFGGLGGAGHGGS